MLEKIIPLNESGYILSMANMQLKIKEFFKNDYFHIQIMCLSDTGIDNEKFQQLIANSDKLCNLKFLQLDNNKITSIVREDLQKLRQLSYFDVS